MKRYSGAMGLCLILPLVTLAVSVRGVGTESTLLESHYYLVSIGSPTSSIQALIERSQDEGFAIVVHGDDPVTTYRGSEPSVEPEAALLSAPMLLVVDGERFLLRVRETTFTYEMRPGSTGYDLVLVPGEELPTAETLQSVLLALQERGLIGSSLEMTFRSYPKNPEKPPLPPQGVAIDSALYALEVAADWFATAPIAGVSLDGLSAEVVVEKLPGMEIPAAFASMVISETDELAKLLVPIHDLTELARSPSVGYLRAPYRPQPAVP